MQTERVNAATFGAHKAKPLRVEQNEKVHKPLYVEQEEKLHHFSSLLFGGDVVNTAVEFGVRGLLVAVSALNPGGYFTPAPGAQSLAEVGIWMVAMSMFVRLYTFALEYVYAKCPQYRTQLPMEHALRDKSDLVGRELRLLAAQNWHDRVTMLADGAIALVLFAFNPAFYPGRDGVQHGWVERAARLVAHQYAITWTMYWAHRAGHVVPFKWAKIHGLHHQASHPLSRVTYQAHCFDNFMNALYGHTFAQFLVPLDFTMYYVSLFLRIMESLEKHSGLSCAANLAHNAQRFLPYAQMPHHHDLHHEGSKRCNFTFGACGGLWDAAFGTRKPGRAQFINAQATQFDTQQLGALAAEHAAQLAAEAKLANADAAANADVITPAELAAHTSADSMWVAIGGYVFDVTKYLKEHPGGEKVLSEVAGRDATTDFEDVGHSPSARAALAALRVGALAGAVKTSIKTDEDSFWNGLYAVHTPIALTAGLVAATGTAGALPLASFVWAVLAYEVSYGTFFA
jgi:cytochrome b involved in lipid metabolism